MIHFSTIPQVFTAGIKLTSAVKQLQSDPQRQLLVMAAPHSSHLMGASHTPRHQSAPTAPSIPSSPL